MRIRDSLLIASLVFTACAAQPEQTTTTTTTSPPTTSTAAATTTPTTAAPVTSEEVAAAFFGAWQSGDEETMESLAEPDALAQANDLNDLASLAWQFENCEGAAGTIFCSWATATDQLTIGVRNIEEPHVVTSVRVIAF